MKKLALAVVALGALVVWAAPDVDPWVKNYARFQHIVPQAFEQLVQANFIDGGTINASVVQAATLTVNGASVAPIAFSCDYDFPSIASGYCALSNGKPCTVTGVNLGAACVGGVKQANPPDGGSAFYAGGAIIQFIARANNLLEIEVCNRLGDGGSIDINDAGYSGYCFN